mmetsp:Transcript_8619/g.20125  ORF Transcript_8619/g.20125 Transcript_8619/m.20125 type:complete len:115 (+) Transcript_8619:989-1333(+)
MPAVAVLAECRAFSEGGRRCAACLAEESALTARLCALALRSASVLRTILCLASWRKEGRGAAEEVGGEEKREEGDGVGEASQEDEARMAIQARAQRRREKLNCEAFISGLTLLT